MDLIAEIKEWAKDRPSWQQEALRRLWIKDTLSPADISELAELCKRPHGLCETDAEARSFDPPAESAEAVSVELEGITHNGNVNALAPGQKLSFGPNLTVVYGGNGAGKSGYSRILKSACRARGSEEIIGNVLSGEAPGTPSATIHFQENGEERSTEWHDNEPELVLRNVSVFDSSCALVYLKERTDVAYRPFGLDLFDRLSSACAEVRSVLEKEKRVLERPGRLPQLPANTEAAKTMEGLSAMTPLEHYRPLLELDESASERRQTLREHLQTLRDSDPRKKIKEVRLKAARIEELSQAIAKIEELDPNAKLATLKSRADELASARNALATLKSEAFGSQPLEGTGNTEWRELWLAAEKFSKSKPYPDQAFPPAQEGLHCVLCQQELTAEGARRLQAFADFLGSTLSRRLREIERGIAAAKSELRGISLQQVSATIAELSVESPELGQRAQDLVQAWQNLMEELDVSPPGSSPISKEDASLLGSDVAKVVEGLRGEASELSQSLDPERQKALEDELRELDARHAAIEEFAAYEAEVDRMRRLGAYEVALKETSTNTITRKSGELTRQTVTEKLIQGFRSEIAALKFRHIEVDLVEAGGGRGALYHKLALTRNPGVTVAKVVSEGEARCLSVAAFFAELATGGASAPIVFDDPVSSLDHEWRERIAERLVQEAANRQVIAFTHDIVFLLALKRFAEEQSVRTQFQYIRRDNQGAGVCAADLPWPALRAKERIGHLRNRWVAADKLFRNDDPESYRAQAEHIYGRLRETWERAFEEVLLGGVVERYRGSIQTQQAKKLSDITDEDMKTFEAGMTKTSRWLPGHDLAAAEGVPFPEPDELKADIDAVEAWIKGINSRRR